MYIVHVCIIFTCTVHAAHVHLFFYLLLSMCLQYMLIPSFLSSSLNVIGDYVLIFVNISVCVFIFMVSLSPPSPLSVSDVILIVFGVQLVLIILMILLLSSKSTPPLPLLLLLLSSTLVISQLRLNWTSKGELVSGLALLEEKVLYT